MSNLRPSAPHQLQPRVLRSNGARYYDRNESARSKRPPAAPYAPKPSFSPSSLLRSALTAAAAAAAVRRHALFLHNAQNVAVADVALACVLLDTSGLQLWMRAYARACVRAFGDVGMMQQQHHQR